MALHVSQSQKNTGDWLVFVVAREEMSADLTLVPASKANSFPVPSFRNEAGHIGLAHLPSMAFPCVESGRINSRNPHRLAGTYKQR